jgi:probable HAF family extracellular repeat protein
MVALGAMPAGFINGHAHDVSADGTVVVGTVDAATPLPTGVPVFQPFRWTAATGMIPLGTLGGPQAQGNAVSADGAVVVGYSFIDFATHSAQHQEAFRWTAATGMVGLGGLPNFPLFSAATDTSADGSVVVGTSNVFGGGTSDGPAFRWTQQEGMVSLGDLPGGVFASSARAVSADGSVIVGYGHDGTPSDQYGDLSAFIWDAVHGMRALRDVLLEQGSDVIGWRLSFPFGISADGRVIGGVGINPNGMPQAWLARLAATDSCAPPSIAAATATPNVIWPPNHKLVPVSVAVDATAVCGPPVCTIALIASDGPSSEDDMVITGDLTALLRAEKSGDDMGRTYTITLQCHDAAGNGATHATTVRVPHDRRK